MLIFKNSQKDTVGQLKKIGTHVLNPPENNGIFLVPYRGISAICTVIKIFSGTIDEEIIQLSYYDMIIFQELRYHE